VNSSKSGRQHWEPKTTHYYYDHPVEPIHPGMGIF